MKYLEIALILYAVISPGARAAVEGELVDPTVNGFIAGVREVRKTNEAIMAELDKAIEVEKAIKANEEQIKGLEREKANLAKQRQDIRNAANQAVQAAQAAQQAANAANLANTPMGGGGGGGGGGKGGGGGGGGRGMISGVEPAELTPPKGVEFTQSVGEADIGNIVSAMGLQPYSPMPASPLSPFAAYQPSLASLTQPTSQEMSPGAIAARQGLTLQGGAKPANPIADGAAAMAAAALANGGGGGKPAGGAGGAAGMPGGGGGGGDNFAGVGRGDMGDDGGKRPTVLASSEGSGGAGGEGAAGGDAPAEEEIAPAKGPNSPSGLAVSPGKHVGDGNPVAQGLMTWVGWVNTACKSEGGKTLVGICAGEARLAASGVAPLTTSVAQAIAALAPSGRVVASVQAEPKPKAVSPSGSSLLDLVSK